MSAETKIFTIGLYLISIKTKQAFSLFDGIKLGRSNVDIEFPHDNGLSKEHCLIEIAGTEMYLIDHNSTNGTFLNGQEIDRNKKYQLVEGDLIKIGNQELILSSSEDPSELTQYKNFKEEQSGAVAVSFEILRMIKMFFFWVGVIFAPYIFAWFTLKKGFSKIERYASFFWMVILLFGILIPDENPNKNKSPEKPTVDTKEVLKKT